jgi:hypothetical protein
MVTDPRPYRAFEIATPPVDPLDILVVWACTWTVWVPTPTFKRMKLKE